MLLRMGYKGFVKIESLLAIAQSDAMPARQGGKLCRQVFDLVVSNFDEYCEEVTKIEESGVAIVPLLHGGFATVGGCCYAQHPFPAPVCPSVAADVDVTTASKLGIRENPPIEDCIQCTVSLKDNAHLKNASNLAGAALEYFEDWITHGHELEDKHLRLLRDGRICFTRRQTWVRPDEVHEAWHVAHFTENLFNYIMLPTRTKGHEKMLAFLMRVGMHDRPSAEDIAEALKVKYRRIAPNDVTKILSLFVDEVDAQEKELQPALLSLLKTDLPLFPSVRRVDGSNVWELHCLKDVSIDDDADYSTQLGHLLWLAPKKQKVIRLYKKLGCRRVTDRVVATMLLGDVNHDADAQNFVDSLMKRKHDRRRLLVYDTSSNDGIDTLRAGLRPSVTEASVGKLKIVCLKNMMKQIRFEGRQIPAARKAPLRCEFVEAEQTIFVIRDVMPNVELQFAISLTAALFDRASFGGSNQDIRGTFVSGQRPLSWNAAGVSGKTLP